MNGATAVGDIQVGIRIAEDRKSVAVEIRQAEASACAIELNLDQLTDLIVHLGDVRQHLLEGHPIRPLEGETVRTVTSPNWYVQVAKIDGSLLAFDHPAFGPVGFAIPREEIAEIVRILKEHLAFPPARSAKRN
ncbi:hypothetical protein ACFOYU_19685 [Microvirga sp. GCM10011540]